MFLGSRLKRLAERMQGDLVAIGEEAGMVIQPGQYSLLATLDQYGPQTIGELTQAMTLSQPSITRMAAKLAEMGLVSIDRVHKDQRHKTVNLTPKGVLDLARAKRLVWPQVEGAVNAMLADLEGSFLEQIDHLERLMTEKPLDQRCREQGICDLIIHDYDDALASDFRTINTEWIETMYVMEQADIDVLNAPRDRIINKGGDILFVEAAGLGVVGACALQKTGEGQFELTKMGVLERARGRKAGEFLLKAVIARAERLGAERLYLLSNQKSAAAIHLYEKAGFRHDGEIMKEFGSRYARCDVAMLYHP